MSISVKMRRDCSGNLFTRFFRSLIVQITFGKFRFAYGFHGNCHDFFLVNLKFWGFSLPWYSVKRGDWFNSAWFSLNIYNGFDNQSDGFTLYVGLLRFDWDSGWLARKYGEYSEQPNGDSSYWWNAPWYLRVLGASRLQYWM